MKLHRLVITVLDFDDLGANEVSAVIANARYQNHCISPVIHKVETRDIGEWSDDNPLNKQSTADAEIERLFAS